jgi:hypothetical protein
MEYGNSDGNFLKKWSKFMISLRAKPDNLNSQIHGVMFVCRDIYM